LEDAAANETLPDIVRLHSIATSLELPKTVQPVATLPTDLSNNVDDYDYRVGVGDVLTITVWEHPELTIPAGSQRSATESGSWVHNDGTIFYPYAGVVKVAGLRLMEIRELIRNRLSRVIENPQVDVNVASFRSQKVYVTGSVKNPGNYPVTNVPLRLLDAINAAGGLDDEFADWQNVILTRDGRDYRLSLREIYERGDPRYNILLRNSDVVNVGRVGDNKVFVLGEVKKPGALTMTRNGLTLAEALAGSEGVNEGQANASGIFVMRSTIEGEKRFIDVYQLNAQDATALILADELVLHPRDIIYVTAVPLARWNRVIGQLMPTIQTIYFGALAKDRLRDPDR
jgi:polysaccharide export outer membrane protein